MVCLKVSKSFILSACFEAQAPDTDKLCLFHLYIPPLMNSVLFDGKLEPKYATVYAGLKNPLFPLFRTPFQMLATFGNGLSNKKLQT